VTTSYYFQDGEATEGDQPLPFDTSGCDNFEIGLAPDDVETPQVLEIRVDPGATTERT